MAMPLENHAFEPQFYSRQNPSASPFWKIVAVHYDDILTCVKIFIFSASEKILQTFDYHLDDTQQERRDTHFFRENIPFFISVPTFCPVFL
jgi:hypothetical protein